MLERNEQLVKEMENIKTHNITLREQVSKLEADLNDAHVCIQYCASPRYEFSETLV
jgi:cell division protein FtsB